MSYFKRINEFGFPQNFIEKQIYYHVKERQRMKPLFSTTEAVASFWSCTD